MSEMIVQVRNKMLRRIGGVNHFVSHNKDYTIQFQFDESWDNVRTKMAVFAYEDGEYGSEIFDGDTCKVPELPREGRILIGVKAGEDLSTELLCIPVCKSADDVITDEYDEPDPKIYEQILDIINNLWNGGTTVYPSPVRFLAAPSTAKVGDLIRVKEVDENGEIKETEAVDVEKELVVVNITKDADGVLHADMTYDEINPLRYTHAVYAKWASGMYPYSTSARMYFGEDLKNVFVFSSSMAGMENWRIAIAQDGSVKINSYELELVGRKVQTIDETTGTGDDSEKNYPSAKAVYDAIGQKIDKNQGTKNAGKILGIGADGNVIPQNKPAQALAGASAPTTTTAGVVGQEYYVIVGNAVTEMYVCTSALIGSYTWDKVEFGGAGMDITGAKIGQIAKITAVDSAGKTTAWEAVDMPSGGTYTLPIASPTVLGGVKPIAKTGAMTQGVGVDAAGALWTAAGGGNAEKWVKIVDYELIETEVEESPQEITFSKTPDNTTLTGMGIKKIIFAGRIKPTVTPNYAYGTFFVNDKPIIIGQNFPIKNPSDAWFSGKFELIGDGYATAGWSNGILSSSYVSGQSGLIIKQSYYGFNQPDITDEFDFQEITKIKIIVPNDAKIATAKLIVYGVKA